jgi:OOP family OmpA-OmpF porin
MKGSKMMKRSVRLLGAAVLVSGMLQAGKDVVPAVAPVAPVEDYSAWYAGVGILWGSADLSHMQTSCGIEDDNYGMMVRAGYDFNQYFGIEARALGTFWGYDDFNGGAGFKHVGIYAKPQLPFADRFNLYGLLGYGWTEVDNDGGNRYAPDHSDWGCSWGIGLEIDLSDSKGDYIEHASYDRPFDGYADQSKGWGLFVDFQQFWKDKKFPHPASGTCKGTLEAVSVGVMYHF